MPDWRGSGKGLLQLPGRRPPAGRRKVPDGGHPQLPSLIIDPVRNEIATQWGTPGKCRHNPPNELAHPNGATPLENGDILVTEITDAWISRITREARCCGASRRRASVARRTRSRRSMANRVIGRLLEAGRVVIFDPATRGR